jgi:hypothetical protein
MKTTQILYILLFIGIVLWILTSTHLLDTVREGFQAPPLPSSSEPIIAKGIEATKLPGEALPNGSTPGSLLYAPYGQSASVGSFPYQDPSLAPAELTQMKKLNQDLKSFLVFEGANVSSSSDPTVQLPLTQLRADSRKLEQEVSVLSKNSGIQSSMTQQDLADIEGALTFLQRKVRLFQTAGVISDDGSKVEGFVSGSTAIKTKATKADLTEFQTRIYAAILTLSSTGTTDMVITARIKKLQELYSAVNDMITKIDKGIWTDADIPVYKEDIMNLLPNLDKPSSRLNDIFSSDSDSGSGSKKSLSPVEKQLSALVGEKNATKVFNGLLDNGSFKVSFDLGYNGADSKKSKHPSNVVYSKRLQLQRDGTMGSHDISSKLPGSPLRETQGAVASMDSAYDTSTAGMDDRAQANSNNPSGRSEEHTS